MNRATATARIPSPYAKGKNLDFRVAVYELTWQPVPDAFKSAVTNGADVHLLVAGQKAGCLFCTATRR